MSSGSGARQPQTIEHRGIALEAAGLSFAHAGAAAVFEDVSLRIAEREVVCLLGATGCGKSTLLRVLAALDSPRSGNVHFLGEPLLQPHPRAALVFQQPSLLPWLDVAGNAAFGLDFSHQPYIDAQQRDKRVTEALRAVGLSAHAHSYPAQLSGGMAQRAALARALAREPLLLFADEPFSALDAITRAGMQSLLVEVVQRWNTAALLVTHDIDEALLVGDRVLLMGGHPGRIVREWRIDIPRPREAHASEIIALRLEVLDALRRLPGAHSPLESIEEGVSA